MTGRWPLKPNSSPQPCFLSQKHTGTLAYSSNYTRCSLIEPRTTQHHAAQSRENETRHHPLCTLHLCGTLVMGAARLLSYCCWCLAGGGCILASPEKATGEPRGICPSFSSPAIQPNPRNQLISGQSPPFLSPPAAVDLIPPSSCRTLALSVYVHVCLRRCRWSSPSKGISF